MLQIFEHIISSAISNHANLHNIIHTGQHGFRKYRSRETQLLETVNDLAMSLNRDIQNRSTILFDFSKAFDKVSHSRLFCKHQHYGILGSLFYWVKLGLPI